MGTYEKYVLPRLMNAICGSRSLQRLRGRVCEGLAGDVVEIGFGSGHNLPFYPSEVTSITAVDPSDLSWKLAGERLAEPGKHQDPARRDHREVPQSEYPLPQPQAGHALTR